MDSRELESATWKPSLSSSIYQPAAQFPLIHGLKFFEKTRG